MNTFNIIPNNLKIHINYREDYCSQKIYIYLRNDNAMNTENLALLELFI